MRLQLLLCVFLRTKIYLKNAFDVQGVWGHDGEPSKNTEILQSNSANTISATCCVPVPAQLNYWTQLKLSL